MVQSIYEETYVTTVEPAVEVVEPVQGGIAFYLSSMLFAATLVCFTGGLFADLTFIKDPDISWSNFSTWQLAFGEFFIALVILFGVIGLLFTWGHARGLVNWFYKLCILAAAVTGLFDNFIHTHDGWTSVWPDGLVLSAVTVGLLVLALLLKLVNLVGSYVVDAK